MDELDATTVEKILSSIEDQSISTLNYDATLRRIEQIKSKEKE